MFLFRIVSWRRALMLMAAFFLLGIISINSQASKRKFVQNQESPGRPIIEPSIGMPFCGAIQYPSSDPFYLPVSVDGICRAMGYKSGVPQSHTLNSFIIENKMPSDYCMEVDKDGELLKAWRTDGLVPDIYYLVAVVCIEH